MNRDTLRRWTLLGLLIAVAVPLGCVGAKRTVSNVTSVPSSSSSSSRTTAPRVQRPTTPDVAVPTIEQPPDKIVSNEKQPNADADEHRPQVGPEDVAARETTVKPAESPATTPSAQKQDEKADEKEARPSVAAESLEDWHYWRGPEYNGISRETGLVDDWNPNGGEGSNLLWKNEQAGGRSTPIVMNGKLYTLVRDKPGTAEEGEKVLCLDANTGETLWENRFNVWLSDVPDTRVGWSSVVGDPETGMVYALGVCDYFLCIDGETGKTLWSRPLHEEFGMLSTYGGRTNFPVICDDLVIVNGVIIGWGDMAKPAHRLIGFNKLTGEVVWYSGTRLMPDDTTYSSPTVTVLNGQKAIVFGSGDGSVWALQPRTGQPIWEYPITRRGLNVAPVVIGDTVYIGHSEENVVGTAMGAFAAIDGSGQGDISKTGRIWQIEGMMVGKSSPVVVDDRIYCVDDSGKLYVLDAKTGETIGRRMTLGTMGRASLMYADGKIYALEANGRWYILQPDQQDGVKVLSKGRLPAGEECNGSPICWNGKVYITSSGGLYCLEDKSKTHVVAPRPPAPEETPVEEDQTPAHVQVVPAEVLMQPGRIQQFQVRLFNSRGQFLSESPAKFEIKGPGQATEDGMFLAPDDAQHAASTVLAKAGDLEGRARVRIVPPLPWSFDFEGLTDLPITWIGARYRHVIRPIDGSNVAVKITTIPKGTRSRCWFGPADLHDYTIQSDVLGAITDNKMPDIGLIAQGYEIDLLGASQKLQIRSWVAHDVRTQKTVDFPWKPDTWYVMKLQAGVKDNKAVLKGKVWPRDEEEPAEWTVEMVDEAPNVAGSPGLYGNAKDAEIYLDNITVTPN